MVDLDPVLEPCWPLPPCQPLVLPAIRACMWLKDLGTITQSHCYDQTSFDVCVELWVDFPPGNWSYLSTDCGGYK